MNKNELSILQTIVEKSFRKEMNRAVESIREADKQASEAQRNYFRDTETLLYSYPSLKIKIAQDEEDLSKGQIQIRTKSKDIVRYASNDGALMEVDTDEMIQSRIASMVRTKKEVRRIDVALESIKDDKYYDIIPLRYWALTDPEGIAETMCCDERTYRRNKNRLVNKLKIVLFGADAL